MILKEFANKEFKDVRRKAGHAAEKQMAFYLKREFQDAKRIFVINDLRISVDGDNAQIDHLVVYPSGVIIVESKSVSGEITINEHLDWIRITRSKKQGMPSPIIQAENQAKILKKFLDQQNTQHHWRLPSSFDYDVFVAVSDNGIINRECKEKLSKLCKADQIPQKIKKFAVEKLKSNSNASVDIRNSADVAFFLCDYKKKPLPKAKSKPKAKNKIKAKELDKVCSKCQSSELQILYGHSYYFKCLSCGANTTLKPFLGCDREGCKQKIRKSKNEFFKECDICKTSEWFFTNS